MKFGCKKINDEKIVIELSGELDMHTIEAARRFIEESLKDKKINTLLLNLQRISFIDSSGIGLILGRYKKIQQFGGKMAIICNQPQVKRILEMSGIKQIVEIYEDLQSEEEGI